MKNKKLFAFLSSLFCVGAICGLFSLLVLPKKEEKIIVNASNVLVQNITIPNLKIAYVPDYISNGVRNVSEGTADYSFLHIDFSVFDVSLYQNNDLSSNRYYLGLYYKSNIFYHIEDTDYNYNFTDYNTNNEDIYIYSDYITDISIFDFNIYLYSMNVEFYDLVNESGIHYYQPYCDIVFQVKNRNGNLVTTLSTKMKYGDLTYSYDFAGQFLFSFLARATTYNDVPFDVLPLREGILLGNTYFDAMENDYTIGYNVGFNEGYTSGYTVGNNQGYNSGYDVGFQQGLASQESAINDAYNNGYAAGLNDGGNMDSTTFAIFNGILQIGMLPVNIFLQLFDFTVLGINLKNFVLSLISTLIVLKVVQFVLGSGLGGGSKKQ